MRRTVRLPYTPRMPRVLPTILRSLLDLPVLIIGLLTAPIWMTTMARRGKLRTDWPGRFGRGPRLPDPPAGRRRVLIHAVSVGEAAAVASLVDRLLAGGGGSEDGATDPAPIDVVVSVTTNTGVARAEQLAAGRYPVIRTPLGLHGPCRRWLDRVRPDLLVLVELEVWPAMTAEAVARNLPVIVINGRLTERSFRRYRQVVAAIRPSFRRLAACAVQDATIADRFAGLGVARDRLHVLGTMKWDGAVIADSADGSDELADALGIDRDRPLVVAGSTAPDETALLHAAVGDAAQLLCAPRRPEWFDDAARDLPGCVRRSMVGSAGGGEEPRAAGGLAGDLAGDLAGGLTSEDTRGEPGTPRSDGTEDRRPDRFLLDTIGELRAAYALADVVVVGRSFGDLHGSDMMEPIGLGRPTLVGPRTGDFEATMRALLAGGGIQQVTRETLPAAVAELLADPSAGRAMAERGRAVIRGHQGVAEAHAELIRDWIDR